MLKQHTLRDIICLNNTSTKQLRSAAGENQTKEGQL